MSRIGKRPIPLPNTVSVSLDGQHVSVKGPKGQLSLTLSEHVTIEQDGDTLSIKRVDESRVARARHGLSRTLVANMVEGVSSGFQKKLEILGVGYRAQVRGKTLVLNVGYSQPVEVEPPDGIELAVEANTNVIVSGIDKEIVGNIAAKIRDVRPPEPYKGKGIRYAGEYILRKAGKSGKK